MGWKSLLTFVTCFTLMSCGTIPSPGSYPFSGFEKVQTSSKDYFHISRLSPTLVRDEKVLFEDNFEAPKPWQMFEEIVNQNPCYGKGLGQIKRGVEVAKSGQYSLRVWSNQAHSENSNHVIAAYKVVDQAKQGILSLETDVFISPKTYYTGQTGPEISVQVTREIQPNVFRTFTAGLQYQSNTHLSPTSNWAIWTQTHLPEKADWTQVATQGLYGGQWYHIVLEFDLNRNQYRHFSVTGQDIKLSKSLDQYPIIPENKFNQPSTWVSLESESRWNNCGQAGIFEHQVYYDNVQFKELVLR